MPLYSLIALVLSLFGATYTAIAAIKNHFDKDVTKAQELVEKKSEAIKESAGANSANNARKYGARVCFWGRSWKWSHIIPIFAFWITAFIIGSVCFFKWDRIVLAQNQSSGVLIASDVSCFYCKIVLGLALFINAGCSLVALLSGWLVRTASRQLDEIHKCAEETMAKNRIQPATKLTSD